MSTSARSRAEKLRSRGFSYNLISRKLGVSKSTLSYWLRSIPYIPNATVLDRIISGPRRSAQKRHDAKVESVIRVEASARKDIGPLSKRDMHMVGLGLYLGEGGKSHEIVRIVNSDPKIIRFMVLWFQEICDLNIENVTIALHLYPDNNERVSKTFWSRETGLPYSCFRKTQVDRRTDKKTMRRRLLPHGTAHVTIITGGNPKNGVLLYRKISGWMQAVLSAGIV